MVMRILWMTVLGLFVAGCGQGRNGDYHLDEKSFGADSLKMISQRIGIALPPASKGLHLYYQGAQIDPSFVAKIEIPASSSDAMLDDLKKLVNRAGGVSGSLTSKVSWWSPVASTIRVQRQLTVDGNYVRVLLCEEPDRWALYVEWIKI